MKLRHIKKVLASMETERAEKYISSIKNEATKHYAQECFEAFKKGGNMVEVEYGNLSDMAAKAVRMELHRILDY